MTERKGPPAARTPLVSGRRLLPTLAALLLAPGGCTLVGAFPAEPPAPSPLPIAEGFSTEEERAAGARLLAEAEAAWAAGDAERAGTAAREVVDRYPRVAGSARALEILARAALQLQRYSDAYEAASRWTALLVPGSREAAEGWLLQARARTGMGDLEGAAATLLRVGPRADPAVLGEATERMSALARSLGVEELERAAADPATGTTPVAVPLLLEHATVLHYRGEGEAAAEVARRILELDPASPQAGLARALVEGRGGEALGAAPLLGAILPREASPGIRPFAEAVEEGIRLAVEGGQARRPVRLHFEDDAGSFQRAPGALAALESEGSLVVLGPLTDDALSAAALARRGETVLLSPTARVVPEGVPNVYSLAMADPSAGQTLARWALAQGIRRVAILYPRDPDGLVESRAFAETFRQGGGTVVLDRSFEPGTSFFQEPLRAVAAAAPQALVLPLSPREVEVIAPQVTFYGLDSLGIRVLGTGGWTGDETLRNVDARHTDGVVAVTSQPPGPVRERYEAFVQAYEAFHRKTLRTPVAALGYDAALLVLRALEGGARTPAEVARALEGIRDLPGATGDLSVRDGRIVRRYTPVLIQNRYPVPLTPP